MDLVRDVLDQLVVDPNGRPIGRVDGIVLESRDDEPPRVAALTIGPSVLGERLHPAIGRWVSAIEQACGVADGRPVELRSSDVTIADGDMRVEQRADSTAAATIELRVRGWIRRIPGA
jgi:hypothetical protein